MLGMFLLGFILGTIIGAGIIKSSVKDNVKKAKDLEEFKKLEDID